VTDDVNDEVVRSLRFRVVRVKQGWVVRFEVRPPFDSRQFAELAAAVLADEFRSAGIDVAE
jgi:hypothetical protein